MAIKTIFITSGFSFTIPSDFLSLVSIEAIGGGGGSFAGTKAPGSGGGAYAKITSASFSVINPGDTYQISIGSGGSSGTIPTSGGITQFDFLPPKVLAAGGSAANGSTGGQGGSASVSVGEVLFSGGSGGPATSTSKGGGGGSAGPNGAGGRGGTGAGTLLTGSGSGGGGGAGTLDGAGVNGSNGSTSVGGKGGNDGSANSGGLGATNSSLATSGSGAAGGGGGYGNAGFGQGGNGGNSLAIWTDFNGVTASTGGGGGGSTDNTLASGVPGTYGAGCGGSGLLADVTNLFGGNGIIIFTYNASAATTPYTVGSSGVANYVNTKSSLMINGGGVAAAGGLGGSGATVVGS